MRLKQGKEIILDFGDTHAPFQHLDTLEFLKAVKAKYKPTKIICGGDELDAHALSNWTSDPDGYSAGHEHNKALEFMHKLYKLFPKTAVCRSNHTDRLFRRALQSGIPARFLKDFHEFMEAPKGWEWSQRFIIDNICFKHGNGVSGQNGSMKMLMSNMMSTVVHHIHSAASIRYVANDDQMLFTVNNLCLIDYNSYAFAYGIDHLPKPTLGCTIINRGVPELIPMLIDKHGRWIGKLGG